MSDEKKTFCMDAHICVEARTMGEALSMILDHCAEGEIAISLHKEGSLNTKKTADSGQES